MKVILSTEDEDYTLELTCVPRVGEEFNLFIDEEKDKDFTTFVVKEARHYYCKADGHEVFIEMRKVKA